MHPDRRWIIVLAVLALLVCHAATLRGMVHQWITDEDMGHGFLVPVVAVWIVWRDRARWQNLAARPSAWGWAVLAAGAGLHLVAAVGAGLFAASLALWVSIAGIILCLGGGAWLRALAFPYILLVFMLPKLAVVYNQVTLPLQLVASRLGAAMLTGAGVGVMRAGNILEVGGRTVLVAEACDGLRFLLPLGFMAALLGHTSRSKAVDRLILLLSAAPIAIVANAGRVALTCTAPALATGNLHVLLGIALFLVGLAGLLAVRGALHAWRARRRPKLNGGIP